MPMLDYSESDVFRGLELAKQHGVKPADIDLALTHGENSQRNAAYSGARPHGVVSG
jgi:hypothetical protein